MHPWIILEAENLGGTLNGVWKSLLSRAPCTAQHLSAQEGISNPLRECMSQLLEVHQSFFAQVLAGKRIISRLHVGTSRKPMEEQSSHTTTSQGLDCVLGGEALTLEPRACGSTELFSGPRVPAKVLVFCRERCPLSWSPPETLSKLKRCFHPRELRSMSPVLLTVHIVHT